MSMQERPDLRVTESRRCDCGHAPTCWIHSGRDEHGCGPGNEQFQVRCTSCRQQTLTQRSWNAAWRSWNLGAVYTPSPEDDPKNY